MPKEKATTRKAAKGADKSVGKKKKGKSRQTDLTATSSNH